jgi:hypothetical protein
MGADKNSSLWLNSAYTPNSQLWIPTRVCQGHVVTMDLLTLGTNPNSIQHGSTTQRAKDLGNLESTRRTVRSVRADCPRGGRGLSARRVRTVREEGTDHPKMLPEPPVLHREKRTVRDGPVDRPPRHGPSDTLVRTVHKLHAPKTHRQNESKERRSRSRKNTKNSWAVRHLAEGPR